MAVKHKAKYIFKNGEITENSYILSGTGEDCEVIDHGNALITPGFVNFHTHLQYTDLKPYKGSVEFSGWIMNLIQQYLFWSKSKKIQSLQNGLKETIKSGVTCVVNLGIEEEFIEVLNDADIKSYVFIEAYSDTEENSRKEFKRLMKLLEKYNTYNVGISPHAPYSVHPVLWRLLAECGALIHTHLYESYDEMKWMRGEPSGIDKLKKLVMRKDFEPYMIKPFDNLIAAHLCQKGFDEVKEFNIAHCPRSNMMLHGKTLNVTEDTGRIGIGTDSLYSNEDLNILHEARCLRDNLKFTEILNCLTYNPRKMLKLQQNDDFLVFNLKEGETPESIIDREGPNRMYVNGREIYLPV